MSQLEFDQIVEESRKAQILWANMSLKERSKKLAPLGALLTDNSDQISQAICESTGKTKIDALSTEVLPSSLAVLFYCKKAPHHLKAQKLRGGSPLFINKNSTLHKEPYGVIGIISPWNYPFAIPFQEMLMALIAGNSVILKVARQCEAVGEVIDWLFEDLDLPEGLVQRVNLPGAIAGKTFINSKLNKLFFTGSNPVGIELAKLAAEKLLPLSLELGGNDAMLVLQDANLERAASGAAWAGYSNCGQSCGGVERIYVEDSVYDEFAEKLRRKTSELRQGQWSDDHIEIGAMATEKQLETVKLHIKDALEKGAQITAQSKENQEGSEALFHRATLLENVNDEMLTMKEETFGPVIALSKVKNVAEAVMKANDSNLGLTASVWTSDKKLAQRVAAELEAGAITINDHLMSHGLSETPWGGYKQSSLGRSHGLPGLNEVTQQKVIVHDAFGFLPRQMWWYPHSPQIYEQLKGAMQLVFGPGRFTGMIQGIKLFSRIFHK